MFCHNVMKGKSPFTDLTTEQLSAELFSRGEAKDTTGKASIQKKL